MAREYTGLEWTDRQFRWFFAVLAVLAILISGAVFGPSGRAYGVEFSKDSFSHRSFYCYVWMTIQITPAQYEEWHSEIDKYLHTNGFVPPSPHNPPRWELVKGMSPGIRGWSGRAKTVCQSLGCWSSDNKWIDWSNKHPELAKILWPRAVQWIRNDDYSAILYCFSAGTLPETEDALKLHLQEVDEDVARERANN